MQTGTFLKYNLLKSRLDDTWPANLRRLAVPYAKGQARVHAHARKALSQTRSLWPDMSKTARLVWWYVLDFVVQEVLEIAQYAACHVEKRRHIQPRHLRLAIWHDADLKQLLALEPTALFF